MAAPRLTFEGGTVCVAGIGRDAPLAGALEDLVAWDPRTEVFRAPAVAYAAIVERLRTSGASYTDDARRYATIELAPLVVREPFPHQREAVDAWRAAGSRGVVVLPTGAGKTQVATTAMALRGRSTVVIVPTLDLMNQWYDVLSATFGVPIGLVGGGYHEPLDVTVTTYDSAYLHMDRLGDRFGLVVFDECHHVPSESYALAARMILAPFRLGLTATPGRADERHDLYPELVGPRVYEKTITELSGEYLAPYETIRLQVPLSDAERATYEAERETYLAFLRQQGIRMSDPAGWGRFILLSSQSEAGRRAFEAYRRQRRLALAAPGKLAVLERLLHRHRDDRTIVFTEDNATVYEIARTFLVAPITHQTKVKERSRILASFNEGTLGVVVTSKVLNEGVNVPEANVGIVLSGSGSVREHVQRLGRILRKSGDKRAVLYELVARGTSEERTSEKRRDHVAYK